MTPMEFKISAVRRKELAQIEAESDCDIGTGFDLGKMLNSTSATCISPLLGKIVLQIHKG
jgi:hypothetical protein